MSILKNKKQADYTIIVGCGRLGEDILWESEVER